MPRLALLCYPERYNEAVHRLATVFLLAFAALAAERVATPYGSVQPFLAEFAPPELQSASQRAFDTWAREKDLAIRARLQQGDLDSMVNLLLFGTSFTAQPRMSIEKLAEESRAGLLRARLADFLAALQQPGTNERLLFLRTLLINQGHPPEAAATGVYILDQLQRVLKEKIAINEQIATAGSDASAFRTRGVSLDTTILPNYAIDAALRELKAGGHLAPVSRAAIIGPGLDFADKESGFDYYPQQTLQPFALLDSLARLGLGTPRLTILDISPRVLDHLRAARSSYFIQLPRDTAAGWSAAAIEYWSSFGSATGQPAEPLPVPASVTGVATRAVRFPAPSFETADVNIVSQHLALPEPERFDLIVATNILVYYDRFEQTLAAVNLAAMLGPGGLLLTNDELPAAASIPLRRAGQTAVNYGQASQFTDTVYWYRRQ